MEMVDFIKWYLVFVFSTSLHEAAHAWAALKLGDDTAFRGGQVTLDPTPHIRREPLGMVVVPIISYLAGGWMIGWASAPYNRVWAENHPRRAAWMALAGPASNFMLVIVAGLAIRIGIATQFFDAPGSIGFAHVVDAVGGGFTVFFAKVLSILFSLNLLLGAFNLLPIPPLDGASIPLLFAGGSFAGRLFSFINHPTLRMVGLFAAWRIFDGLYHPIQLYAVNFLYPGFSYR
jgi:Zn-dependent protease